MKQDRSKRLGMDEFMMFFAFSKARQYSVIEGAKDPGVNLIWIGCSLLIVGLGLAFYWPTWEIRFILDESPGKTEVLAGGSAPKSRDQFVAEFEKLLASLIL